MRGSKCSVHAIQNKYSGLASQRGSPKVTCSSRNGLTCFIVAAARTLLFRAAEHVNCVAGSERCCTPVAPSDQTSGTSMASFCFKICSFPCECASLPFASLLFRMHWYTQRNGLNWMLGSLLPSAATVAYVEIILAMHMRKGLVVLRFHYIIVIAPGTSKSGHRSLPYSYLQNYVAYCGEYGSHRVYAGVSKLYSVLA
jgi:hypothetical protein